MSKQSILVFEVYPFEVGQKIRIVGGARKGDWEVIGMDEKKVRLRCPVSHREVEWDLFCYFVDLKDVAEWPE